jgi:hypothetical protein
VAVFESPVLLRSASSGEAREFDGHDDLHQAGSPGSMSRRIYGDDPWT